MPHLPMLELIVVRPFGPHRPGDTVTDPDEVAAILAGEHRDSVVRIHPPQEI